MRLLHLWLMRDAPFVALLIGDEQSYDSWARGLAAGDWVGTEVFYQAPLYPYVLGSIYALFGRDLLVVRLLQAVVGAASCVLLADAGRRLFGSRSGLVAGALLAVYPTAVFFGVRIDKSTLDLFFVCLALSLIGRLVATPRPALWLGLGSTLGALTLTRENALVLIPVVAVWIALDRRRMRRNPARHALAFGIGLTLVLAPVALRNLAVGGQLHLTTSQLGTNLFYGNNPDATGTYQPLRHGHETWKQERNDATELAQRALGRRLTSAEVSRYWSGRALEYVTAHPLEWAGKKWTTFRLLWNAIEIADSEDQYSHAETSIVLRWPGRLLHFGTLVPLALFGAWVTWSRRASLIPLYLLVAAYAASVVLFFVLGRLRFPLVPLLILFAAAGPAAAAGWWRSAGRGSIAACLAATAGAALFCNWPMLERDSMKAVTQLNVALALRERGDLKGSVAWLEGALALEPDFVTARYNLGNALRAAGRPDAAIEQYRHAVGISPDHFEAINNWGAALLDLRRLTQAASMFRRALLIEPDSVPALHNLATVLRLEGDLDGAVEHYRRALALDPTFAPAARDLQQLRRPREPGGGR